MSAAIYTLPLPKGDSDSVVFTRHRRATPERAPIVVTVPTVAPAPALTRAEWLAINAAERAAAATPAPAVEVERPTPAPTADIAPLRIGFTPLELREHARAVYPTEQLAAVSTTKRPTGCYTLSHPLELPEGGRGRYIGGCLDHRRFILCPSRRSANVWRDEAIHWCPVCIGDERP